MMSTILFVTDAAFYPPYQGDGTHLFHLIRFLRRRGWVVPVVHYHDQKQRDYDYERMSRLCDGLIVYYPTDADLRARGSDLLDDWCPERFATIVADACRAWPADALFVQYVFLSKCFERLGGQRLARVLDADNIFAGRREVFQSAGIPYDWFSTSADEELAAWRRADVLLAVQEAEMGLMARAVPDRQVVLAPQVREVELTDPPAGKTLLYVGADNAPNRIGLQAFIDHALPQIQSRHREVVLRVVGRVGESVQPGPGIDVLGVVADLGQCYREANIVLNLAPTGTGLKTKTLEAFCHGRCLVSTSAGLQGFEAYPSLAHVADNPSEFAETVCRLLETPELCRQTAKAAGTFALGYFSPDIVLPRIEQALRNAIQQRSLPS